MKEWLRLLKEGVTAAHVIDYVKKDLIADGFKELDVEDEWELQAGEKYYVELYGTNCIAFRISEKMTKGVSPYFRVAMAHSDYPCFQIKPQPDMHTGNTTKLNVEIYGGMYQKSWFDRPLGVGGSLMLRTKDPFQPETVLYKSGKALCIIPSLAIHMDRELNKKGALDTAKELVPITSLTRDGNLVSYIADAIGRPVEDILAFDLYTFVLDQPVMVGLDDSMISSPRLDNLSSVAALQYGLKKCDAIPENTVDIMAVFDNEEVGSRTKQGADSELLSWILDKIGQQFNKRFDKCDVMNGSFLLSVDVAHGVHPNYPEKSDVTNFAELGKGFSIKSSVGQKYGTTAKSAAVLKAICEEKHIPYTIAINRTGIPGGSTLGPIVSSHLPFPCADIGMPVLSMHSACELGAVADYEALQKFLWAFYQI